MRPRHAPGAPAPAGPAVRRPLALQAAVAVLAASLCLALLPLAPAALAAGGGAGYAPIQAEPRASLPDIEDEVMCPVCGTLLALASESPQANRERDLIRGLIAQGLTKDQIKDRLVAEFGPEILATPDTKGFDLAAWLVPGLAVLAAAAAILTGLRRWRRETNARDDAAPEPTALSEDDARELDRDLARYEP